jgi:hypothetical protein
VSEIVDLSHFLPLFTTVISAAFAWNILGRWRSKPQALHLLWWGLGVAVYGAGTLVESLTTLFGWQVVFFKAWYIVGALLGGAPLALGTVYLLMGRRAGHIGTALLLATVSVTSVFVILSPVNMQLVDTSILNSKVLVWQSIRMVSPFVNGLAALFLIGGAFYSAGVYFRRPETHHRFVGNLFIAVGAILPGVGGMFSRLGHTEILYVGELAGLILIWWGYRFCQKPSSLQIRESVPAEASVSSGK